MKIIEEKLKSAKSFAEKSIQGKNNEYTKEDYIIFQISKFLLLKESIIKKEESKKIFFDYNKNKKYLPAIKYIVDYIEDNGDIRTNDIEVNIEPKDKETEELKKYIKCFHKIRDTFAHGAYDIDSETGHIILDNNNIKEDAIVDDETYIVKCNLPIEVLELFSYISKKPKQKYNEEEIKEYYNEINNERKKYNFNILNNDFKIINYYNNYSNNKEYSNTITDNNIYNDKYINKNYDNDKYINYYKISQNKEEELSLLYEIVKEYNKLSKDELKKLYDYLIKLGLLDSQKDEIKKNPNPDETYVKKINSVIEEISSILGVRKETDNGTKIASVYNYMQLMLSFKHEEIIARQDEEKRKLGHLRISKLNPHYLKDDSIINGINSATKNFISNMKYYINNYNKSQQENEFNEINNCLNNFYNLIIEKFINKNISIITTIRNSLEHGNINDLNGKIILHNKKNQRDLESTNFYCLSTPENFYEIFSSIEENNISELSFNDFLNELKYVLKKEIYNELLNIINEVKRINAQSLVNVLSNEIKKTNEEKGKK